MKKPSQSTSLTRWYRCQNQAVSRPITMPPKTPGFWYAAAVTLASPVTQVPNQVPPVVNVEPGAQSTGKACSTA